MIHMIRRIAPIATLGLLATGAASTALADGPGPVRVHRIAPFGQVWTDDRLVIRPPGGPAFPTAGGLGLGAPGYGVGFDAPGFGMPVSERPTRERRFVRGSLAGFRASAFLGRR